MAKSYAQKMQEDWERGQLKKYKRDNGLERKDVLVPQKVRERDFAGRLGTAEGNGAGVRKERVRDYAGRSAGTAGGKGDRGNVSVTASGAGGKSSPSMNKTKSGKPSGGNVSDPRRMGKAWVQDGRVKTWNSANNAKSGGYSIDDTRDTITQGFNDIKRKNKKR